ncbi:MAG: hypothetical protein MZV63_68380 [Marinilabiliales bacterium]|nr:hypothetical protein [Marinilabiliales bacterium]
MKTKIFLIALLLLGTMTLSAQQTDTERPGTAGLCDPEMRLPHAYRLFRRQLVWPTTRIGEAWRDGLDAISITDHVEYQPRKQYVPTDHNAAWKIAKVNGR